MKLISLTCPNCGASLEAQKGMDSFFCMYCGAKVLVDEQADVKKSRIRAKSFNTYLEYRERQTERKIEERKRKEEAERIQQEKNDRFLKRFLIGFAIFMIIIIGIVVFADASYNPEDTIFEFISSMDTDHMPSELQDDPQTTVIHPHSELHYVSNASR